MSIEQYIKSQAPYLCDKVFIAPDIPDKKLNGAVQGMTDGNLNPDYILAIADTTVFGSAKEGCLFTGEYLFVHALMQDSVQIRLSDMEKVDYQLEQSVNEKGKQIKTETLIIHMSDDVTIDLSNQLVGIHMKQLADMLTEIIKMGKEEDDFASKAQGNLDSDDANVSPLSDMDEEIKITYIQLICQTILREEEDIDQKKYSEIVSLMVRIQMTKESRFTIREYILNPGSRETTQELIEKLKDQLVEDDFEIVKLSLIQDVISVYRMNDAVTSWKEYDEIGELAEKLSISDEQADYMEEQLISNEEILSQRQNDNQIEKTLKDAAAKAGAVGVPLAALYFTGTVGVSAAGITSGLAALGMKGLFGLSPMMTGIGALVLVGVGTYSSLKKVTGIKDLENNKVRETMLMSIIKNSQETLNCLIEDVNEISERLVQAVKMETDNKQKIKELSEILNMLAGSTQTETTKLDKAQRESLITTLPKTLDVTRLKELTSKATERRYFDAAMTAYEEVSHPAEESDGNDKMVHELREYLSLEELETLSSLFEIIGYNNVTDATVATAKGAAKKWFSSLAEGKGAEN